MRIILPDRARSRYATCTLLRLRDTTAIACIEQGAGRPLTSSTGATESIFLGRDSEARELRAELGGIY